MKTLFSKSALSRNVAHPKTLPLFAYFNFNKGNKGEDWRGLFFSTKGTFQNKGFETSH